MPREPEMADAGSDDRSAGVRERNTTFCAADGVLLGGTWFLPPEGVPVIAAIVITCGGRNPSAVLPPAGALSRRS